MTSPLYDDLLPADGPLEAAVAGLTTMPNAGFTGCETTSEALFTLIVAATDLYVRSGLAGAAQEQLGAAPTLATMVVDESLLADPGAWADLDAHVYDHHLALVVTSIVENLERSR